MEVYGMKETDLAYIAGLIDGEGYIGIKKTTTRRNGRVNPQYQERIQIRMVDEPAIKFIADVFGTPYYKEPPNAVRGRPLYCMSTTDRASVRILTAVRPYLKVKARVTDVVFQLRALRNNPHKIAVPRQIKSRWGYEITVKRWQYSPQHIAECERLYQLCKHINSGQ